MLLSFPRQFSMLNMSSWTSVGLLLIVNGLLPLPFWLFATGFFPYKPMLPGQDTKASSLRGHVPAVPFDRVIFMVVDALRRYTRFTTRWNCLADVAPVTSFSRRIRLSIFSMGWSRLDCIACERG